MKAADITDAAFLDAMRTAHVLRPGWWVTRWDTQAVLEGHTEFARSMGIGDLLDWPLNFKTEWPEFAIPEKVFLAKSRTLIRRGLIDGCACGCRGDFTIIGEDWDTWREDHPHHAAYRENQALEAAIARVFVRSPSGDALILHSSSEE